MNEDFMWIKKYFHSNCNLTDTKNNITPDDVINLILDQNDNINQNELEGKYHIIQGMAEAISIIHKEGYKSIIRARSEGYVTLLFGEDKFNRRVLLTAIEGDFKNNTQKS